MHGLMWIKSRRPEVKKIIFNCIVKNIILYNADVSLLTKRYQGKIGTVVLDSMRRCLQATRRDKIRTENI